MYCSKCGVENPEGAKFCHNCGCELKKVESDRLHQDDEVIRPTVDEMPHEEIINESTTSEGGNDNFTECCCCVIAIFVIAAFIVMFAH